MKRDGLKRVQYMGKEKVQEDETKLNGKHGVRACVCVFVVFIITSNDR